MALGVDPRIEAILTAARGGVAAGNAQRRQLALMTALGLTDAGLLERSNAVQTGAQGAGFAEAPDLQNLTYGVQVAPNMQGRAYREGYMGLNNAAASRGAGFSSATRNARFQLTRDLDNQVNRALRDFDAGQANTLTGQAQGIDEFARQIADIRFEQGRAEAERREVQPQPAAAAPGGGAGALPRIHAGRWSNRSYAENAARQIGNGYVVRQRGPAAGGGFILVRG